MQLHLAHVSKTLKLHFMHRLPSFENTMRRWPKKCSFTLPGYPKPSS